MYIKVTNDCNEEIFYGDADEFLENNQYDDELDFFLNDLDENEIGTEKVFYGNQGEKFIFEKVFISMLEL